VKFRSVALLVALFAFLASDCSQVVWREPKQNGSVVTPVTQYICIDVPDAQLPAVNEAVGAWSKSLRQWKLLEPITDDSLAVHCDYLIQETTEESYPGNDPAVVAWTLVDT